MGWISTVKVLADIFDLDGFYIWHMVMATAMVIIWCVLATLTAMAFWQGKIFMAKPEDVLKDIDAFDEKKYPSSSPSPV